MGPDISVKHVTRHFSG